MTAQMIPFPRLVGDSKPRDPQNMAHWVHFGIRLAETKWPSRGCANGMPGHPPCRSAAELEAMLAAREARDVLAGHVGVLDSLTLEQRRIIGEHDGPVTIGDGEKI